MKNAVSVLFLLAFVLFIYKPLFQAGVPATHDGQMHVARIANYFVAYKQGQWPVRWAPNLNYGFGYPVFNFNYPLPYLISIPFVTANLSIESAYKATVLLALIVLAVGMFFFARMWATPTQAILASVAFALSPYIANLIYVRGGIGELWSLALAPWILWFIRKLATQPFPYWWWFGLVATGSMWLLAHNVFALIGAPFLVGFSLYWIVKYPKTWLRFATAATVALFIASFFWVPALMEKAWVNLDSSPLASVFYDQFLFARQFFFGAFSYGYSLPGPVDGLDLSIGWFLTLVCISLVFGSLYYRRITPGIAWGLLLVGIIFLFSTTVGSAVAALIPGFHFVQFPWRLVGIASIVAALLVPSMMQQFKLGRVFILILFLLLCRHALTVYKPASYFSHSDFEYYEAAETTSTLDENMPREFEKSSAYPLRQSVFADALVTATPSGGVFEITVWNGSRRSYSITVSEPNIVVERSALFGGFETKVNGAIVPYVAPPAPYKGLVAFALNPGTYTIETRFTQNTPGRRIGNTLSALGIFLLVGSAGIHFWQSKLQGKRHAH